MYCTTPPNVAGSAWCLQKVSLFLLTSSYKVCNWSECACIAVFETLRSGFTRSTADDCHFSASQLAQRSMRPSLACVVWRQRVAATSRVYLHFSMLNASRVFHVVVLLVTRLILECCSNFLRNILREIPTDCCGCICKSCTWRESWFIFLGHGTLSRCDFIVRNLDKSVHREHFS